MCSVVSLPAWVGFSCPADNPPETRDSNATFLVSLCVPQGWEKINGGASFRCTREHSSASFSLGGEIEAPPVSRTKGSELGDGKRTLRKKSVLSPDLSGGPQLPSPSSCLPLCLQLAEAHKSSESSQHPCTHLALSEHTRTSGLRVALQDSAGMLLRGTQQGPG